MSVVYTIFNQKGGVGKTSITCNIASSLVQKGKEVLVIDLDSQGNTSDYLAPDRGDASIGTFFNSILGFKIFKDPLEASLVDTRWDRLSLIPASLDLAALQPKLEARFKIKKLAQALLQLCHNRGFDYVLIDTPPAYNFYTISAFLASQGVFIPFDCDVFSAGAVHNVVDMVEEIADDHQHKLTVKGVVVNQFQSNARLPTEAVLQLEEEGLPVLKPWIHHSVMMKESHATSTPLPWLKPNHKLTRQFHELTETLLKME